MIFAEPENVKPAKFSKKSRENQVGNMWSEIYSGQQ